MWDWLRCVCFWNTTGLLSFLEGISLLIQEASLIPMERWRLTSSYSYRQLVVHTFRVMGVAFCSPSHFNVGVEECEGFLVRSKTLFCKQKIGDGMVLPLCWRLFHFNTNGLHDPSLTPTILTAQNLHISILKGVALVFQMQLDCWILSRLAGPPILAHAFVEWLLGFSNVSVWIRTYWWLFVSALSSTGKRQSLPENWVS